ncbi:MAG: adenine-specific methyltransferase EcoRI family protein [Bacteroidales bacterium]|jgi:hypothetical protein|nr:adenine-specific methyltransferase EcoRI family protein [Bacteroidales bacterium]
MANQNLTRAKQAKNDEFYTQLSDIEKELNHYRHHFKGKVVLCNCDDPRVSNFFHYFSYNFEQLGLKKLIATCYKNQNADLFTQNQSDKAIYLEYYGDKNGNRTPDSAEIGIKELKGDGDFRSAECIELLRQSDIVCTNPPFSLFREYVALLAQHNKKFLILGNMNAITYKEIFKLIKDNKLWTGVGFNLSMVFKTKYQNTIETNQKSVIAKGFNPRDGYVITPAICWFTNLEHTKRHEDLILYKTYKGNESDYPKYDNYDAIEISKTADIPCDYDGVMGVPITFLGKYNPEQFELLGSNRGRDQDSSGIYGRGSFLNGVETFKRLFIRKK